MGAFSIWHWLIVLAVVLVLFGGGGKISRLMGDVGKGLKNFKKSVKEDDDTDSDTTKPEIEAAAPTETPAAEKDRAAKG